MTAATSKHAKPHPGPATDPALKAKAMQLAATIGAAAASRQTGVPRATINSWLARARKRALIPYARLHGANSERAIAERSKIVHEQILTAAPWLSEDRFLPAVSLYLRSASRSQLLDEYIERIAAEKGIQAVPARTLEQATTASRAAFSQATALGLTPAGYSSLKILVAGAAGAEDGIAKLIREGTEAREAREATINATSEETT